ncbi:hypothetical protein JANAI62_37430 [Jannaschia pagri]|uniref:TraD/TraG TraM recognition site domain-containing protein n=1 Tax=Jannaschia pagri TaxID=2829797 RepID=A0ABQ4NRV1_9RHOB|nr:MULTISPECIES: TraM recognition domain-containing protein [unclassified Jannaschia]GIT93306.1 hypothetical protein JANAI61_37640 [Jannaschia sp. AI_61]GIT97120.1 hypothetical protein JANAI62_37430 [Jannaschia sp. AI_62]
MAWPFTHGLRALSASPVSYHHRLGTPLLRFGRRDVWRLRDACEGTGILGGVGSGKTSGSGQTIAASFLTAGMGGMVLCAKNNEADRWRKWARAAGRERSLFVIDASGTHRINIMDYVASTLARDGFEQNLAAVLLEAAEASRILKSASGGGGDNSFFRDYAELCLNSALPLLNKVMPQLRLRDLQRFIDSAPRSMDEASSPDWQKSSFCSEVLIKLAALAQGGDSHAARLAEEYADFWLVQFATLGDRTRGSVVATLSATLNGLMTGKIAELFSTDTTIVPDITQEGAILVLDMSAHEFGSVGIVAQQILKLLWMKSIQHRRIHAKMRPQFLWIDECQYFFSEADAEFLSTSREYRACPVYITQDLPTFYAALGGDNAENRGKQIVAKFQTRLFHANTDPVTNAFASEIIGKSRRYKVSWSTSSGRNSGGSGNQGERESGTGGGAGRNQGRTRSIDTYEEADVLPDYFGNELRNGGKENRFKVDAIVVRAATRFRAAKRNRLKVTFDQRARA